MIVEWRGQPVWVVKRTPEILSNLGKLTEKLSDPESTLEQQPSYAQNEYRSIKPEISILLGICTHLGCSPTFRPEVAPEDLGPEWVGGYFCPCHGSKFDLAGRVYKAVPAPTNLLIPPHQYLSDTVIEIGVDGGNA
jgi:ubiquinol-cytochrome c reductase iron-sulfur subunit